MQYYNPFSLDGKTILITGASSGIGQKTAIECSKLGARVIITARNQDRLQNTFANLEGDGHKLFITELTKSEEIINLVSQIEFLNGVVLCAGKVITSPFAFNTRDKYDDIFNINFFAPMELLRQLVKKKKLEKDSSVVFVSSIGGIFGFSLGNSIYGASKAAITSTMKFCAKELAPKKIRVNSINPGMVNTGLIKNGTITNEQHEADMQSYPLKRYGEPKDIAYGIIYLLSDASSWMTGHTLVIDGGISI
jgi:NAD(P)-dependent dehydrogenase (short-subunit alcohol dehydrogenase family)